MPFTAVFVKIRFCRKDTLAPTEREGYGGPCDVTSLSLTTSSTN